MGEIRGKIKSRVKIRSGGNRTDIINTSTLWAWMKTQNSDKQAVPRRKIGSKLAKDHQRLPVQGQQ